jgi:hypothetical protein
MLWGFAICPLGSFVATVSYLHAYALEMRQPSSPGRMGFGERLQAHRSKEKANYPI